MARPHRELSLLSKLALLGATLCFPHGAGAADWGFHAGAHFGYANEGQATAQDYLGRDTGVIDLQALPGVRLLGDALLLGPLLDARLQSQLGADATNFNGFGLTLGPAAQFDFHFFRLLVSWDWRDRQSITVPANATFQGSGFHFVAGVSLVPHVDFEIQFVKASFNTLRVGATEFPLADPVTEPVLGVGLAINL